MPNYKDQLGRIITIDTIPERIVSLVPSITELLYDLQLDKEVVGITKFCVHPKHWFRAKTRVGGTKNLRLDVLRALQPELILANKEENIKEQIESLAANQAVWISDVYNLATALEMIKVLSTITGRIEQGEHLVSEIAGEFEKLQRSAAPSKIRATYLIWKNPFMTIGADTFIHDMLLRCGFENIYADQNRYPVITIEELKERKCELLLLSSEPFPFKEMHRLEMQQDLPGTRVECVDGEMFSWYGSRLKFAAQYFQELRKRLVTT